MEGDEAGTVVAAVVVAAADMEVEVEDTVAAAVVAAGKPRVSQFLLTPPCLS